MRYRTVDVLRDEAFQGHRGEVLAPLGPNGGLPDPWSGGARVRLGPPRAWEQSWLAIDWDQ